MDPVRSDLFTPLRTSIQTGVDGWMDQRKQINLVYRLMSGHKKQVADFKQQVEVS